METRKEKQCSVCKETLPINDFYIVLNPSANLKAQTMCKQCNSDMSARRAIYRRIKEKGVPYVQAEIERKRIALDREIKVLEQYEIQTRAQVQ